MDYTFEVTDKNGRKIRLTKRQWAHTMRRHAYMEKYIEEMKETLIAPDKLFVDRAEGYYYKSYKNLKQPNRFVFVLVRYLNNHGFVITAYLEKDMK